MATGIESASTLEELVNAYIFRALLSHDHFIEMEAGFGGVTFPPWPLDADGRRSLAYAIGDQVLGPTWYFDVVEDGTAELPRVRIVITGRTR